MSSVGRAGTTEPPPPFRLFPFRRRWQPWLVLAVAAAALYANTLRHEYALDDGIVINRNRHVLAGLRGLPGILGSDSYQSFYEQVEGASLLPGGRYRPLSLVSFALEQELIGTYPGGVLPRERCWDGDGDGADDPAEDRNGDGVWNDADCLVRGYAFRHFNNVVLYVASVLLLYLLLGRHLLRRHPDAAFLAAFLFCIHPVHTEVVANVKSRDEILSLLFIALALIEVCRYLENRRSRHLAGVAGATLLAVFSKEYAFALPVVAAATVHLQGDGRPLRRHLGLALALVAPLAIFAAARLAVLPPGGPSPPADVLSDPYLLATPTQEAGTKIFVWSKYLALLFFPAVLSSDYSYRSIPYRELLGAEALLSLALFAALAVLAARLLWRRHPAAWGLVFFFATFLPAANVLFDIGATMGERLVYHASLGWAVCVAWVCAAGAARLAPPVSRQRAVLLGGLAVLTLLFGWRTVTRNRDWRNDTTLFTRDVTVMPDSVLCLGNAGSRWIDLSDLPANRGRREECLRTAIGYLERALALYPDFLNGHLSVGLAHFKLREYDQAERSWRAAARLHPASPYLARYFAALADAFARRGAAEAGARRFAGAVGWYERAAALAPREARIWYDLGRTALFAGDCAKARAALERCLQLDPGHQQARRALARCQ